MKAEYSELEKAIAGSSWISSVELGAGIYLLDGRTHLAGHSSPAERLLVERGALLVASIRFDPDPHEAAHPTRSVRVLGHREAASLFPAPHQRS